MFELSVSNGMVMGENTDYPDISLSFKYRKSMFKRTQVCLGILFAVHEYLHSFQEKPAVIFIIIYHSLTLLFPMSLPVTTSVLVLLETAII